MQVTTKSVDQVIQQLPSPFRGEKFSPIQEGVYDDPATTVYLNEVRDFAFLYPLPRFDYTHYKPRFKRLALDSYRKTNQVADRRLKKSKDCFTVSSHFL